MYLRQIEGDLLGFDHDPSVLCLYLCDEQTKTFNTNKQQKMHTHKCTQTNR